MGEPSISIVIPANNEEAVIGRLLESLGVPTRADEVVVVCDGCTDDTAAIARSFVGVKVIEQPRGGKPGALNAGDANVTIFPRFYVDADIRVSIADLRAVAAAMTSSVHAGAPRMVVDVEAASWAVRRYYDIWTRLPYATESTLGSGVMGVTEEGRGRFEVFPDLIGDDEMVRRLFTTDERVAEPAGTFVVTAPRRLWPLIRIKTRSRLGILQLNAVQGPAPREAGAHGTSVFSHLARQPRLWVSLAVFALVRVVLEVRVRWRLWRGDFAGWARDDSSRVDQRTDGSADPSSTRRLRTGPPPPIGDETAGDGHQRSDR